MKKIAFLLQKYLVVAYLWKVFPHTIITFNVYLFSFLLQENCKELQPTYVQSCQDNCGRGKELKRSKPYNPVVNKLLWFAWYSGDRVLLFLAHWVIW